MNTPLLPTKIALKTKIALDGLIFYLQSILWNNMRWSSSWLRACDLWMNKAFYTADKDNLYLYRLSDTVSKKDYSNMGTLFSGGGLCPSPNSPGYRDITNYHCENLKQFKALSVIASCIHVRAPMNKTQNHLIYYKPNILHWAWVHCAPKFTCSHSVS